MPCLPFVVIVLQTEVCLSGGDLVSVVSDLPGAEPLHGAQHPPHPAQQVQTGQDGHTESAMRMIKNNQQIRIPEIECRVQTSGS